MVVVAIVGVLAAIAIPQYQTYVFRSHVQRVVEESGAIRAAIEVCLANGKTRVGDPSLASANCDPQATGSTLQATGGNAAPTIGNPWSIVGSGVPDVSLSDDTATIVATFGNLAGAPLKSASAATVRWERDRHGTWSCRTSNIDPKYANSACPL
ncbi:pilin [Variovorax sp. PDNC026]|uniref:pilin n=1 Tax=Variovorax sp. PDNC026 TaxID=2811425 RepID=UPI0023DCF5F7|nr:pilin [Variovorax sp. PDNC026]